MRLREALSHVGAWIIVAVIVASLLWLMRSGGHNPDEDERGTPNVPPWAQ